MPFPNYDYHRNQWYPLLFMDREKDQHGIELVQNGHESWTVTQAIILCEPLLKQRSQIHQHKHVVVYDGQEVAIYEQGMRVFPTVCPCCERHLCECEFYMDKLNHWRCALDGKHEPVPMIVNDYVLDAMYNEQVEVCDNCGSTQMVRVRVNETKDGFEDWSVCENCGHEEQHEDVSYWPHDHQPPSKDEISERLGILLEEQTLLYGPPLEPYPGSDY